MQPKPNIKSQDEIFTRQEKVRTRANDIRRDTDTTGNLHIGLYDIDDAILYYFTNIIKPVVLQQNELITVPIQYASPERWVSIRKQGYLRDKRNKIICPLITYKRVSMSRNRSLSRNIDANNPRIYKSFQQNYSRYNMYDNFSKLNNIQPTREQYNIVIPDYVNLTYDCMIWTYNVEQMNKIIEEINYSESSYWGDPERFKFFVYINDFSKSIEVSEGEDRLVRTTFTLNLNGGYIISDALQKQLKEHPKSFTTQQIKLEERVINNINEIPKTSTFKPNNTEIK